MSALPLDVVYTRHPDGHTLVLEGDLDLNSWSVLRGHLDQLVNDEVGMVRVDLAAVRWIDSAGLGVLAEFQRQLRERGRGLVLVRAAPELRNALAVVGLDAA